LHTHLIGLPPLRLPPACRSHIHVCSCVRLRAAASDILRACTAVCCSVQLRATPCSSVLLRAAVCCCVEGYATACCCVRLRAVASPTATHTCITSVTSFSDHLRLITVMPKVNSCYYDAKMLKILDSIGLPVDLNRLIIEYCNSKGALPREGRGHACVKL
jgi:hypothetical protein